QGMQERVAVLQGHLQLESQPGRGCCITVEIPMQISKISEISIAKESSISQPKTEISISQEFICVNQHQQVKIGEWQHLNLDEWQDLTLMNPISPLIDVRSTLVSSSDLPFNFQASHHSIRSNL
ncbi:MAG TPA: hypothetical protein DEV81_17935, partial [Cyanobacteria bacterium UBA11049]|nr:hypothetical protein [Cyanobacteria bacterium UBA11049]